MIPSLTATALILAPTRLSPLDLAIVALYLIAITLFGLRFSRRNKEPGAKGGSSLKSYFLADNTIPWWAIALSIVSAETSTLTIVSIPGVAFGGDFGFLQIVLGYMLGRIVVAALFLPKYFRGEMLTAYQLIDQRFGHTLHKVTAGLFLLTRAAAEGVRVFAISIVVGIAIGTGDTLSIFIITALTLLYTFEGGMAAVIWTDVVQMALYVAGTLIALFTLGRHVPGGWTAIHTIGQHSGKFHMLNFTLNLTKSYTFWAGILGGTFLTMASHGTDQLMVQRMLAARNLRESRLALLSSGLVIFLQFTLFLLIGVGLFVFYGSAESPGAPFIAPSAMSRINHSTITGLSPDRIFPTFIVTQMPHGIAGLLVAAILAAAMSNLSAALNSLASTTVVDFYIPWCTRKKLPAVLNEQRTTDDGALRTTLISRLATIVWAIVLFLIAVYSIQHGGKGHVVETGLSIASVAYGCLLGVFLLGTLTRYATQWGAILGMIVGFAFNLALWLAPPSFSFTYTTSAATHSIPIPHVAFTWYVLLGALVTFAIGSLASIALPKPRTTRRIATAALLFLAVASAPCAAFGQFPTNNGQQTTNTHPPNFSEVSSLIETAIAQKKLPGAVVLIGHNGQVVFHHAYGLRKLAGEPGLDGKPAPAEPMTEDTVFDMASLTKVLVTTTAILQLYEQHKLDLDAPVATYLPAFAASAACPEPLNTQEAAKNHVILSEAKDPCIASSPTSPQTHAWKSQITVRQLLTHYSGLPEDVDLKDAWGLAAPDKAEGIRRALAAVPYGPPGLTFKYSDINFITLGALVEMISGKALQDYARSYIFNPLALSETHYKAEDCGCLGEAPAYGHPRQDGEISVCSSTVTCSPQPNRRIAPTAHDNEGTSATNPDFDHLLRGTVHDPTTRRMGGVAGHAGVFSTAQDASRFCDALLDKLVRNTGPFPLEQSTLRLATIPNEPVTAVQTATIFTQSGQTTIGEAVRGLGWDLNTAFSRPRGEIFPLTDRSQRGSFGHTGFTGTSLWIDPASNTYVILLANAIHPHVSAPISTLRGQVATAAARALGLGAPPSTDNPVVEQAGVPDRRSWSDGVERGGSSEAQPPSPNRPEISRAPSIASSAMGGSAPTLKPAVFASSYPEASASGVTSLVQAPAQRPQTLTGIDVLEQTNFATLKTLAASHKNHLRIAVLTNQSGLDSLGNRTIDILAHASPELELTKIFSPEHGLYGRQDTEHPTAESDPTTHLLVISVYGPKLSDKRPKQSDLRDLDAVVIDLQDAGVRFWTYETLVGYFLQACSQAKIPLVLLDRPNPIAALAPQGPISDLGFESTYTDFMPIPLRHSLTLGELARYFNANATQVQLKPELPDARATIIGDPTAETAPPVTQPGLHADLTVIPMQNWARSQYFDETHLPWTPPSPNLRTPRAAVLYPALGLTEQTNISVGRGTETPFEDLGASYIDAQAVAAYLTARHIPGILITPTTMTIAEDANHYPFHGQTIPGLHFAVTDRATLDSPELGVELLAALHYLYPTQFQLAKAKTLLASATTLASITAGQDPRTIAATWHPALEAFRQRSSCYLLYP